MELRRILDLVIQLGQRLACFVLRSRLTGILSRPSFLVTSQNGEHSDLAAAVIAQRRFSKRGIRKTFTATHIRRGEKALIFVCEDAHCLLVSPTLELGHVGVV